MKFPLLITLAILCVLVTVWWIEHELNKEDVKSKCMGNESTFGCAVGRWLTVGICGIGLSSCHEPTGRIGPTAGTVEGTTAAVGTPRFITIKPAMPPPVWAGWGMGRFIHLPNLERYPPARVLSAEMPEGCHLLSLHAPVTSSCPEPVIGTLDLFTDGAKEGEDGYFVELAPGKQWVQVDLGQTREIWGLWLWHYHRMSVIYKGVIIQVGMDADVKNFTTLFSNDFDNSMGFGVGKDPLYEDRSDGRYVAGKGVRGRYVRFWSCGRYEGPPLTLQPESHYTEVEIYGK